MLVSMSPPNPYILVVKVVPDHKAVFISWGKRGIGGDSFTPLLGCPGQDERMNGDRISGFFHPNIPRR